VEMKAGTYMVVLGDFLDIELTDLVSCADYKFTIKNLDYPTTPTVSPVPAGTYLVTAVFYGETEEFSIVLDEGGTATGFSLSGTWGQETGTYYGYTYNAKVTLGGTDGMVIYVHYDGSTTSAILIVEEFGFHHAILILSMEFQ